MEDPRQQHGNHTWDLVINYHRCPQCGYIIENRDKYEKQLDRLQKSLACPHCHQTFTVIKKTRPSFGPLLGHYE